MKKIIAITLAMLTLLAIPTAALADGSTTITTTVPDATYTLNIPADQEIPFGAAVTNIGNVTVTDSSGFAVGKNLKVTLEDPIDGYGEFVCADVSTTIPYKLFWSDASGDNTDDLGSNMTFLGTSDGTLEEQFKRNDIYVDHIGINIWGWDKALAGDYSTILTFTSEIVAA